ncbi:uncharacterized protein LOC131674671 [Phymastichus coffea]|uniref:uncharacterized protein LOC131674671 n=1 Tax=Phymastichus coffea TaxID=108790 RepID=UPI00273B079E|nr:uncharacterized protein LOC131674671 [Phymastichus coffea]
MDHQEEDKKDDVLEAQLKDLKRYANDMNLRCIEGMTDLHVAAMKGSVLLTKHFIKGGQSTNAENAEKKTPLVIAMENGNFEVAEVLLRSGARMSNSIDAIEGAFYSILTNIGSVPSLVRELFYEKIMSRKSIEEIVTMIDDIECPFSNVVAMQNATLTRTFIDLSTDIDDIEYAKGMETAVKLLDTSNIDVLINHGPDREQMEQYLYQSIKRLAVSREPNLNAIHFYALKLCEWNDWNPMTVGCVAEIFERAIANVLAIFMTHGIHEVIKSALHGDVTAHAFANGDPQVVLFMRRVVQSGYTPEPGLRGKTALHFAMRYRVQDNVEFLVSNTPTFINHRDSLGRTPLFELFYCTAHTPSRMRCLYGLLMSGSIDVQIFDRAGKCLLDFRPRDEHVTRTSNWTVIQPILAHLAMIESQGHEIDEKIHQKIKDEETFAEYYAECQSQLKDMQNTTTSTDMTTYKLLLIDFFSSNIWVRDHGLRLLHDRTYLQKFHPYYSIRLKVVLQHCMQLNIGRAKMITSLCKHFSQLAVLPGVVDIIVSFLPVNYLKKLARSPSSEAF